MIDYRDEIILRQKEMVQVYLIEAKDLDEAYYQGQLDILNNVCPELVTSEEYDQAYCNVRSELYILRNSEEANDRKKTIAYLTGAASQLKAMADSLGEFERVLNLRRDGDGVNNSSN
jgi:hypothetical protein